MAKPQVPRFGNWDNGNVDIPYTAYFDNARRERVARGLYTNPYDPPESPHHHVPNDSTSVGKASNHLKNRGSGSGSEGMSHSGRPRADPGGVVVPRAASSSFSSDGSGSKHRNRHRSYSSDDHNRGHGRVGSIPKFGAWDENDPASGEGYTIIFQQARRDKESPFSVPAEPVHRNTDQASSFKSKVCCCLFPDARD